MHLFYVSYLLLCLIYDIIEIGVDNMTGKLCPKMEETLTMLGKKLIGLIVFSLLDGPKKFSDIEKFLPSISARMLNERLKELEQLGIIKKSVYSDTHVRIEYSLTRKGIDLSDTFKTISEGNEKWN